MTRDSYASDKGRVVHCKRERYDVYVGRRGTSHYGVFGNPFIVRSEEFRDRAIRRFEEYARARISTDAAWRDAVKGLHGKVLGCWCAPKACHGDVLLKLAAELNEIPQARAVKAHGGTTDAGANGVPTPGSFGGLENREEAIAKPSTNSDGTTATGLPE